MKNFFSGRTIAVLFSLIFLFNNLKAQESQGGTPPSFILSSLPAFSTIELPKPDLETIKTEDSQVDYYRIARLLPVNLNTQNSGTWHGIADGSRIWRLKVVLSDAKATAAYFDKFWLPEGGKLYLYNEDKSQILGAYTFLNNHASGLFSTELLKGETVIFEYFEPAGTTQPATINISDIAYVYRGVESMYYDEQVRQQRDFGDAVSCMVNVNCSEGANWQNQRNAVVRILLRIGSSAGWCSGSLLNNTAQDCKNYILTADHCGDGATTNNLTQWTFYFNYQASGCSNPTSQGTLASQTRTGCTFRSRSTGGISSGSDFYLVELTQTIPASYNPYYAGWSRQNTASTSGVGIHHGAGDIKKISTFTQTTLSVDQNGFQNPNGEVWYVAWAATANGHGIIEQGSSGSSLFNSSGLVMGIASAGSVDLSCTNRSGYQTVYGKFSYSWESNGTVDNRRLRPWLDPAGTNPTTLQGKAPCNSTNVDANFTANTTTIFVGQSVNFTDISTGSPTAWSWTFTGGTPASSTVQNPTNIVYNTAGTYTVALTASKTGSTDTETKVGYITVLPPQTNVCDTLSNIDATDNFALYSAGSTATSGYVSGHNQYGDLAKADRFSATAGATISQVQLFFGVAKSNTPSRTFNVRIWDANGTNGAPGTVLGTTTVTYGTAASDVTAVRATVANFANAITLNGPFYAGIEFAYQAGDTLALITNTDGETTPTTAWEKQSNGAWFSYDAGNGTWEIKVSHLILPVVCPPVPVQPVANFTNTTATVCSGSTVTFTNTSTGNPTTYSWSFPGGTPATSSIANPTITYNTAGTYNVSLTVTNSVGSNTKTSNLLVVVRAKPSVSLTGNNSTCGANGTVTAIVSGGQSPYNYTWSNGATTQNLSGLTSGNFTITVRDANTCSATSSATVNNTGAVLNSTVNNVTLCNDNNNGSIQLTVTNGIQPITYSWNTGATSASIFGLAAGTYVVNVNTNGCSFTETYTITAPVALNVSLNVTPATNGNNGSASTTVSGGAAPYTYSWSNGATTSSINNLAAGNYSLTVSDNNGCWYVEQFIVDLQSSIIDKKTITKYIDVYPNPSNGVFNVQLDLNETKNIKAEVYNALGVKVSERIFDIQRPETIVFDLNNLPNSTYILKLSTKDWGYFRKLIKTN
jgi:PKD repeat protein